MQNDKVGYIFFLIAFTLFLFGLYFGLTNRNNVKPEDIKAASVAKENSNKKTDKKDKESSQVNAENSMSDKEKPIKEEDKKNNSVPENNVPDNKGIQAQSSALGQPSSVQQPPANNPQQPSTANQPAPQSPPPGKLIAETPTPVANNQVNPAQPQNPPLETKY